MNNKISFITNVGYNNLEYLKLLLKSLKENLYYKHHEILVFVDRDNEGIVDYLEKQKSEFEDLKYITHKMYGDYVGYQLNINILVKYAKYNIISYIQSDMIICKNYDKIVIEELEENCVLCATRIEPPLHPPSDKTFTMNLGVEPSEFRWESFIQYSEQVKSDKSLSYFFAPFTFYKNTWEIVNGHDSLFRRSREDSDILQKFLHNEVKIKQTFKANVYHFTCVSSRGINWFKNDTPEIKTRNDFQSIADMLELKKFIRKWGWFNHGEKKLIKYDVDLLITNSEKLDGNIINNIEPYFSRVWLDNENKYKEVIEYQIYMIDHIPNGLIGLKKEEWEKSKKFYNTVDFFSIYKHGVHVNNYNCLIQVDSKFVAELIELINNNIHEIISTLDEKSEYSYDNIKITVNKKIITSDKNLTNTNPEFDYSLLRIN